jgi:uncharacterized protein YndB with AHSA1/START domain
MTRSFRRTFELAVPVERAWRAFTDREELANWFAAEVPMFEARPGGAMRWGGLGYQVEGTVEEIEPNRRIRWTEGPGVLPGTTEITVSLRNPNRGPR